MPSNPYFELDYRKVFSLWLFKKYLKEYNSIYEFGCGTGFNLVLLAKLYPQKKLHGLDFVPTSVHLVDEIRKTHGLNMTGHLFDMRVPGDKLEIEDNSAIFTVGAIEQLANDVEPFLEFLLDHPPKLCVHVEPIIELYNKDDLMDYLAVKFHRKRGYTDNYLTKLLELEVQGKIEILKVRRHFFGSLFMDGFSYIIWRPKMLRI